MLITFSKYLVLVFVVVHITFCYSKLIMSNTKVQAINDRPVVGVLAQESFSVDQYFPDEKYKSFIAASYVKFIESGGARVIPIMIGQNLEYYTKIVKSVNGILLPGGAALFNQTGGYSDAGVIIYNIAKEENIPILGICLGMELIIFAEQNKVDHRSDCCLKKVSIPLEFKPDFKQSKTFGEASDDIIRIFEKENVTYNYHKYCVTEDVWKKNGFNDDDWHILSTNKDKSGLEFISSFESRKKPIFGLQFHPEKMFEWVENRGIVHTKNSVKVSQYLAQLFIDETRKTPVRFLEHNNHLHIYNFPTAYIGNLGASYQQVYMFKYGTVTL